MKKLADGNLYIGVTLIQGLSEMIGNVRTGESVEVSLLWMWQIRQVQLYILEKYQIDQHKNCMWSCSWMLGMEYATSELGWDEPSHLYRVTRIFSAVRSKVVVLLLLTFCLLLLLSWESVTVLCLVVRYFMSILVLQSSWWGIESWLLCLICLPGVSWWLSGSSLRCHGVVCTVCDCGISW